MSQWTGGGKQYLSYGIQLRMTLLMHDIYAHVCLDGLDLVLGFKNVCKAGPTCFSFLSFQVVVRVCACACVRACVCMCVCVVETHIKTERLDRRISYFNVYSQNNMH